MNITKSVKQLKAIKYVEVDTNYIFINWALELMTKGIESENLYILAGLDINNTENVEYYFNRTIDELYIDVNRNDEEFQNEEELLNIYSLWLYEQIQISKITAREAIRKMWNVCRITDFNDRFSLLHNLSQDIESIEYGEGSVYDQTLTTNNFDEKVLKAFGEFANLINKNSNNN